MSKYASFHARARKKGVNPLVYWMARGFLQPLFHVYFRMTRTGRANIPVSGAVIVVANHRSFLDPFFIGTCTSRPMYYVAKKELFKHRLSAWFLNSLGAFPVDRGAADGDMITTAKEILARGDALLIFAEGTRIRKPTLGRARRGIGRLALETGAPVVPVAILGSDRIRRGWRVRPAKVKMLIGKPLTFPHVENASPQLARTVTDRIWPCITEQWGQLGGPPSPPEVVQEAPPVRVTAAKGA